MDKLILEIEGLKQKHKVTKCQNDKSKKQVQQLQQLLSASQKINLNAISRLNFQERSDNNKKSRQRYAIVESILSCNEEGEDDQGVQDRKAQFKTVD